MRLNRFSSNNVSPMERSGNTDRGPGFARRFVPTTEQRNLLASAPRPAKQRLPGVLAVAGTSVVAFQKPDSAGDYCLTTSAWIARREESPSRWRGAGRGQRACCLVASILSKTAGVRAGMTSPVNDLIEWPAQTGEDRICFPPLLSRRAVELVRTSTPRASMAREGRLFTCVLPDLCNRPACLEVRFGRDVGVTRRSGALAKGRQGSELRAWKERQEKRRSGSCMGR